MWTSWILVLSVFAEAGGVFMGEVELLQDLFSGYSPEFRPKRNYSQPMEIFISSQIRRVQKLDESNEILHTIIQLATVWTDEYLRWNISETNGIGYVTVPGKKIWTPLYFITNSIDEDNMLSLSNINFVLHPNGMLMGTVIVSVHTTCSVDLRKFPFDKQRCHIYLMTNQWRSYVIMYGFNVESFGDTEEFFIENTEWKNLKYNISMNTSSFDSESMAIEGISFNGSFDTLIITIDMERNPSFYVIYLVTPAVIMAFVSVMGFLLPPESGERIGLSITVLLSYTVFILAVSDITPRGGSSTSYLVLYITIMEINAAFVLAITVVLLHLFYMEEYKYLPQCLANSRLFNRTEDKDGINPWHKLTVLLDRLALCITSLIVVVSTVVFMVLLIT